MKKTVLTFGFISGAVLSALMVATLPFAEKIGFDRAMVVGYTTMVLAFLLVFFGIRSYRDNVGHGRITFGRAFMVGILITLISSACYVVTWQVVSTTFMPDHLAKYNEYALEKERSAGATEQQLEEKRQEAAKFMVLYENPLIKAAFTLAEVLPVGLLMTLVSAAILRRRQEDGLPA
ncbi:MAG: DUF4199 domain-containing protein [Longimicrobiales bacterium]